jgi:hypothetical protein
MRRAGGRRTVRQAPADAEGLVGLCAACAHARAVVSGRGSTFWRCGLSASDGRFSKYPRLPVMRCAGFVGAPGGEGDGSPPPRNLET